MTAFQTEVGSDLPILWWELDAASGAFPDASASGRTGTVTGTITRNQPGFWGTDSISMAGAGSVAYSDSVLPNVNTPWAMTIMFKTLGHTQQIGQYGNYKLEMNASGQIRTLVGSTLKSTSSLAYNDGYWHMIVLSREASFCRVYIDGVVGSPSFSVSTTPTPVRVAIGLNSSPTSGYGQFDGEIDEVVVNFGSLSASRVAAYWSHRNVVTSDLVVDAIVISGGVTLSTDVVMDGTVFVDDSLDLPWFAGDRFLLGTGDGEFSDWFAGESPLILESGTKRDLVVTGFIPNELYVDGHVVSNMTSDVQCDALVLSDGAILTVDGIVAESSGGRAFPSLPQGRLYPRLPRTYPV